MNLNKSTAFQDSDISARIIKDDLDIFKKILCQELNKSMEISRFSNLMRQIVGKLVYCQTCQKF